MNENSERLNEFLFKISESLSKTADLFDEYKDVLAMFKISFVSSFCSELAKTEPFMLIYGPNPLNAIDCLLEMIPNLSKEEVL